MNAHVSELNQSRAKTTATPNWPVLALAVSIVILIVLQIAIWRINGLWLDELYSLWASDPSTPFREDFFARIAPDTNPPGYYSLLYFARLFVSDGRIAAIALNAFFLAAAAIVTYLSARRAHLVPLALLSFSGFLLSGPVGYYMPEARAYFGALAVAFVASWFVVLQVVNPGKRLSLLWFISFGAFAAFMHLYASLYCCCLAAGLLAVAMTYPSHRSLFKGAIALGGTAALISSLWLLTILNSLDQVAWIQFNVLSVTHAILSVLVVSGAPILLALVFISVICGNKRGGCYPLLIAFSVTYFLFFMLPVLVSFEKPVIVDYYWLVGSPGIIVFASFQLQRLYLDSTNHDGTIADRRVLYVASALASVWIVLSLAAAYQRFAYKMVWRGAVDVSAFLARCPSQSVHVGTGLRVQDGKLFFLWSNVPFFAFLTGQPADKFVPAVGFDGPLLSSRDAKCPVLGWAEHLSPSKLKKLSDGDLLRLLRIEASDKGVTIRRYYSGFVVLRR